jgi:hypothetical protein
MKESSQLFLELFLLVWKCAYISMEGEWLSVKLFGNICFINLQGRKARSPVHQGLRAAFGDSLAHWGLLVQHAQPVQDHGQLNRQKSKNSWGKVGSFPWMLTLQCTKRSVISTHNFESWLNRWFIFGAKHERLWKVISLLLEYIKMLRK